MAMTKRVVKRSPKVKSVANEVEAAPTAPVAGETVKIPTAREFVQTALAKINMAHEQLELATYALEDGKQLFAEMPEDRRTASVKAINDFLQKSYFGITSLRDEVMIALGGGEGAKQGEQKEKLKLPTITVDVPHLPVDSVLQDGAVDAGELAKARHVVGVALRYLAQSQIQAFESESMLGVLTFFTQLHKDLSARCEAK